MAEKVSTKREFVRGAARFADLVYVISQMKTLLAQDIAHVSLVGLYKGKWGDAFNTTWNATAVAVAKLPSEMDGRNTCALLLLHITHAPSHLET